MANQIVRQLPLEINTKTIQIAGRKYQIARLTERCWLFTALATGATHQFSSPETMWQFIAALTRHLRAYDLNRRTPKLLTSKPSPVCQQAVNDFLSNAEAYFKTFSQIVNSKVGNYTLSGMQWQLRNAELATGLAASKYAQLSAMGL